MTRAVVVAPHPDDEVLGTSSVLRQEPVTVVHVSDGVPPWTDPSEAQRLVGRRQAECHAAWEALGAQVGDVVRLGFADLAVWRSVAELHGGAHRGGRGVGGRTSNPCAGVPGWSPRSRNATSTAALLRAVGRPGDRHRWLVYSLYGYDVDGSFSIGALDPIRYPGADRLTEAAPDLERKAVALGCFSSQLRAGSILQRWLDAPAAEHVAQHLVSLPVEPGACFYDDELDFARFGVTSPAVRAMLDRELARGRVRPQDAEADGRP